MVAKPTIAEIEADLIVLGDALLKGRLPVRERSDDEKKSAGLAALKARICPYKERITHLIHGLSFQAAVTTVDTMLAVVFQLHVPVTKIAEMIVLVGLDKLCDACVSNIDDILEADKDLKGQHNDKSENKGGGEF